VRVIAYKLPYQPNTPGKDWHLHGHDVVEERPRDSVWPFEEVSLSTHFSSRQSYISEDGSHRYEDRVGPIATGIAMTPVCNRITALQYCCDKISQGPVSLNADVRYKDHIEDVMLQ